MRTVYKGEFKEKAWGVGYSARPNPDSPEENRDYHDFNYGRRLFIHISCLTNIRKKRIFVGQRV
jgi:hypothetical protein